MMKKDTIFRQNLFFIWKEKNINSMNILVLRFDYLQ